MEAQAEEPRLVIYWDDPRAPCSTSKYPHPAHTWILSPEWRASQAVARFPDHHHLVAPKWSTAIGQTNVADINQRGAALQWLQELLAAGGVDRYILADPDLVFYNTQSLDGKPGKVASMEEMDLLLAAIWDGLADHPMVGLQHRQTLGPYGHGKARGSAQLLARAQHGIYGLSSMTLWNLGIRWDVLPAMEETHVLLELLLAGHTNVILSEWAYKRYGSAGFSPAHRDPALEGIAARQLKGTHPRYVSVSRLTGGTSWAGGSSPRQRVSVSYAKAREDGMRLAEERLARMGDES